MRLLPLHKPLNTSRSDEPPPMGTLRRSPRQPMTSCQACMSRGNTPRFEISDDRQQGGGRKEQAIFALMCWAVACRGSGALRPA